MAELNLNTLAEKVGMTPDAQGRYNWDQPSAQSVAKIIRDEYSSKGEPILVNGAGPAWLMSAITHAAHPCEVSLYDPKLGKGIDIPKLAHGEPNPDADIQFTVTTGKDCVKLEWSIDTPSGVYDMNKLKDLVVPEIPNGKSLVISGRGPNPVAVAIAEAYAHTAPDISFYQPQLGGYTCGITHDPNINIGDFINSKDIEANLAIGFDIADDTMPDVGDDDAR